MLAACAVPPEGSTPATGEGSATTAARSRLRPLAPALAVPPGAAPRSQVSGVNYGLSSGGASDLPPDDGAPGDGGPREIFERGGASWYGIQFHQKKTANGERFDMGALTAAHKTLPFNTRVCVRSLVNGREVLVRINDRGPYAQGRIIDLSRAAADAIGLTSMGIKQVALSVIDRKDQRCGGAAADLDAAEPVVEPAPQRARVRRSKSVNPRSRR
ncbi:MAG: septal ring lytic transglycosylase RlpA family protein [Variovorax sp.]